MRELRSTIERSVLFAQDRLITPDILEQQFPSVTLTEEDEEKRELLKLTLMRTKGNVTLAAEKLGMSRRHLYRLRKKYNIPRKP